MRTQASSTTPTQPGTLCTLTFSTHMTISFTCSTHPAEVDVAIVDRLHVLAERRRRDIRSFASAKSYGYGG
jgi:hypothetical protein